MVSLCEKCNHQTGLILQLRSCGHCHEKNRYIFSKNTVTKMSHVMSAEEEVQLIDLTSDHEMDEWIEEQRHMEDDVIRRQV